MRVQLVIEYINGDREEVCCDDYSEGKTSLMYYIRLGVKEGEHHIPYSSIKRWSAHRF